MFQCRWACMRAVVYLSALFVVGLVACESKKTASPEPSASAARATAATSGSAAALTSAASSAAPSALSQRAQPSASSCAAAPFASAAASPCLPNAKRYDEPKFCVVLPEKTLDVTYEGGAEEGSAELED